jgi:hypothetical protein
MAFGTVILALALIDELMLEWRGQRTRTGSDQMSRNE